MSVLYWQYLAVGWSGGLLTALAAWAVARQWPRQALGLGLASVPLWLSLADIYATVGAVVRGGTVLLPESRYGLSGQYIAPIVSTLGYLFAGFVVWAGAPAWQGGVAALARALRRTGVPTGASEARSAAAGLALFPLLAAGYLAVANACALLPSLCNGDESGVFSNMTLYHATLISAAAAVAEELLFRGFVLALALRLLGSPSRFGWRVAAAVALQGVLFGFLHSGYGNWLHVVEGGLFGLVAGLAAWRFGILCTIIVHFLADFALFALEAAHSAPWIHVLVDVLLLADFAFAAAWAWRWLRSRRAAHASAS